jgi:hypothetical protein
MPFRVIHKDNQTRAYSDDVLLMPDVDTHLEHAFFNYCVAPRPFDWQVHDCPKYISKGEPLFTIGLRKITAVFRKGEFTPVVYAPVSGLYYHASIDATNLDLGPYSNAHSGLEGAGVMILLEMGHSVTQSNMKRLMNVMYGEFCDVIRYNSKYLFEKDKQSKRFIYRDSSSGEMADVEDLLDKQLTASPAIVDLWKDLPSMAEFFRKRLIDNTVVLN